MLNQEAAHEGLAIKAQVEKVEAVGEVAGVNKHGARLTGRGAGQVVGEHGLAQAVA